MHKRKLAIAAISAGAIAAGVFGFGLLNAQQPGFTRTVLQTQDISIAGHNVVQARAEFIPGGAAGRHTHPGEEIGYILEGTLQLEIEGKQPVVLKAGDAFFVPAGVVHDGKNIGAVPAKVLATYVVEKGKPVASPAK
jgi:quercetin dioxygenase-like cupin family protein